MVSMISIDLLKLTTFKPSSLALPNAWVGHLPFAYWVIEKLNPSVFVELGTHSGNSYFAFCQKVHEAGLQSKCFAVDTWLGDEHAGEYKDEIYNEVNFHNEKNYKSFSKLLRTTFDLAADEFLDKSIDLLHIDGLHTYEAVRHDFEKWLPKLAPGAIVMFHDTNVFERNFGVWQLWKELQALYPLNIEFTHSHGLGVLQLNDAAHDGILSILKCNVADKRSITNYFKYLGDELFKAESRNPLEDEYIRVMNELTLKDKLIEEIRQSTSWKITFPLRFVKGLIQRTIQRK